jgi:lon-related putative ATP-dependent protease
MKSIKQLTAAELCQHCDPEQFDFETTEELEELAELVGQPRAVEALQFGIGIQQAGYNIFALGPAGTGKLSFVRQLFEEEAKKSPVPADWCYVNNFEQPHKPRALHLSPGKGAALRQDMKQWVEDLRSALSSAFESQEYQTRRQVIVQEFKEQHTRAFEELQRRVKERNMMLLATPGGLVLAPAREGKVLSPDVLQKLSEEEQKQLKQDLQDLQESLQKILLQVPGWQREMRKRLSTLNREIAGIAIGGLIGELRETYADFPEVITYLDTVQADVIENASDFLDSESESSDGDASTEGDDLSSEGDSPSLRRYQVNVLVAHNAPGAAPVVYEDNPTYQNLVGRIEHIAQMGTLLTDFNLIKPGALHRANGGYLILDARKLLLQPYAWEGLKRALQSSQVRIESVAHMYSLISTVTLEPEPIPLNVKVALLGDRQLYYLLWQLDPDFGELFKVAADFDERLDRSTENQQLYARLIGTLVHKEKLRPFNRTAVARIIDHSARVVEDVGKLSARMGGITDLLREADYWAGQAGNSLVTAGDVQQAIDAQHRRADRVQKRLQEEILKDTLLIDTAGAQIGQVNGLAVLQLGNFAFGNPTRITAQVRLGEGKVIDIEREVELGGPIHSKGVLILTGFLGARYTDERPLSLSASLVFEQSYGGVEGDSASSAELYALLSAIARLPIKQSFAVTGSVNQHGQVQAIGGVNEKIEGFFDICQSRGLTGEQGVLIPASNVRHLMLRQDVVDAVAAGKFHVYPVETVDQGVEILTGIPAGTCDKAGNYPEGSVNFLVESRLSELAQKRQAFSAPAGKEGM